MTSSFTVGKANLEKPAHGEYVDAWDVPVNSDLDAIDACFSTSVVVTSTGGTVNLTQANMRSQRIIIGGTLVSNLTVNFYPGIAGLYTVGNGATVGPFTITLGQNAGLTVTVPVNTSALIFCDGVNVFLADAGGARQIAAQFVPPGAIMDFAMSGAPSGWLVCDGSAVSRTTYAALFTNIATTWGVGNGSTTFNLPDFRGQFRRGWDNGAGVDPARAFASAQNDLFAVHNHGINDPGHFHTINESLGANATGALNQVPNNAGSPVANTNSATTGITIQNTGGSETRPKNYAVLACIKT